MFKKQGNGFSGTHLIRVSLALVFFLSFSNRVPKRASSLALTNIYTWADISGKLPNANVIMTNIQIIGNNIWIPTMTGGILVSHNGGNSFLAVSAFPVYGIFFQPDALKGFSVGGSTVYRTTDGGTGWGDSYLQATLRDVYFANANIGYVAGNVVYRTPDGGNTWIKKTNVADRVNVYSISFPDPTNPDIGYAAVTSEDPSLYKTINGGDSWQPVDLGGIVGGLNSLEFTAPNNGWAVGNAGKIFHYNGSGWTQQTSNVMVILNDVSFSSDGSRGCAVGNSGVIVCTFDGGINWFQEVVDSVNAALTGVEIASGRYVYVVGYGGTFLQGYLPLGDHQIFLPVLYK